MYFLWKFEEGFHVFENWKQLFDNWNIFAKYFHYQITISN